MRERAGLTRTTLRRCAIAAALLLYAVLAHYSNATPNREALGALLAIAPLLLALLLATRRSPYPKAAPALAALVAGSLLLLSWRDIERNYSLLYLLQQCGAYLMLAVGFGRSLLPGHVALCTRWAGLLHGPLPPDVRRYTRTVTAAWTLFFLAIVVLSVALYVATPLRIWSLFSNFLTLPLTLLMFVGEYAIRRRVLPSMHRISLAATWRAYLTSSRRATPRY